MPVTRGAHHRSTVVHPYGKSSEGVVSDSGVGWRKFVRLRTKKPAFAENWYNHALVKVKPCFGNARWTH